MAKQAWASCPKCGEMVYLEEGGWFSPRNREGKLVRECEKCKEDLVLYYGGLEEDTRCCRLLEEGEGS